MALTAAEQRELDQLKAELADSGDGVDSTDETFLNEMHPDITVGERALIKNFANSPEVGAKYLQKKGFQTTMMGGELFVKKPDETEWKALDPSGITSLGELGKDVLDVGYDVGSGIVGGAATAAGGLAGNLPGAAAAGAGSSALLEAGRQEIGQGLGLDQEVDPLQVGIAGVAGGVAPLAFGTGASAKQIAAKALESGIAPEVIEQSQKGALSRLGQKVAKKIPGSAVAEVLTGVPKKATEALPEFEAYQKTSGNLLDEEQLLQFGEAAKEKVRSGLMAEKQEIGKALETSIKNADTPIDIKEITKPLEDIIIKLEKSSNAKTPAVQEEIAYFKKRLKDIFTEDVEKVVGGEIDVHTGAQIPEQIVKTSRPISGPISASRLFELQDKIKDIANLKQQQSGLASRVGQGVSAEEKQFIIAANTAYKKTNEALKKVTGGVSQKLKDRYSLYSKLQNELSSSFKDAKSTITTLSNVNEKNSKNLALLGQLKKLKRYSGVDVIPESNILYAKKYYGNPSMSPISSGGTTSTSRTISLGGLGGLLGYTLGGWPGAAAGAAAGKFASSPWATKNIYIPAGRIGAAATTQVGRAVPSMTSPQLGRIGVEEALRSIQKRNQRGE